MSKLNQNQVMVFTIAWLSYGSAYLLRKPFGIIKLAMKESMDLTDDLLGYIELAFSLPYAFGSLFFGFVGDKLGQRVTLGGGLIGSAIATSFMGLTGNFVIFLALLFISGLFQSLMAPAALIIIGNRFSKKRLTTVMGIFCTSMVVGNVASTFMTVKIAEISSWHYVFYLPSAIAGIVGILELIAMRNAENPDQKSLEREIEISNLKFWQVLNVPKVFLCSFALFFLKGIRNAFFFWLPYYLSTVVNYNHSEAGWISLIYEVGSFIGPLVLSTLFNLFVDDLLASLFTVISTAAFTLLLLLVNEQDEDAYILFTCLFFTGAFVSTTDVILGASFVTKLADEHGGARSSIISVINGIGSIGNIVSGPMVAYSSYWFGMRALVPCIVLFCFFTASAIFVLLLNEPIIREEEKQQVQSSSTTDLNINIDHPQPLILKSGPTSQSTISEL